MPVWNETIDISDVFHSDLPFEDKRDIIVRRIKNTRWFTNPNRYLYVEEIVENLSEARHVEEFDGWWNELYDQADIDRVWIATL